MRPEHEAATGSDGGDKADGATPIIRAGSDIAGHLTDDERQVLIECEDTIRRGLAEFQRVGDALILVHDQRLYRDDFDTFEDYLRVRWGLRRNRGYQFMQAAQTIRQLLDECPQFVDTSDLTESHLRELARIMRHKYGGAEAAVESVTAVRRQAQAEGGKVTAQAIRQYAERHGYAPTPRPKPPAKPRPKIEAPIVRGADNGRSLADVLNWAARQQFDRIDARTRAALVAFIDAHLGGVDEFAHNCAAERDRPSLLSSAAIGDTVRYADTDGNMVTGTLWSPAEPSGYWIAGDDGLAVRVDDHPRPLALVGRAR